MYADKTPQQKQQSLKAEIILSLQVCCGSKSVLAGGVPYGHFYALAILGVYKAWTKRLIFNS